MVFEAFATIASILQIAIIVMIIRELFGIGYKKGEGSNSDALSGVSNWWDKRKEKQQENENKEIEMGKDLARLTINEEAHLNRLKQGTLIIESLCKEPAKLVSMPEEIKSRIVIPMMASAKELEKNSKNEYLIIRSYEIGLRKQVQDFVYLDNKIKDETARIKALPQKSIMPEEQKKMEVLNQAHATNIPKLIKEIQDFLALIKAGAGSGITFEQEERDLERVSRTIETDLKEIEKNIDALIKEKKNLKRRGEATANIERETPILKNNITELERLMFGVAKRLNQTIGQRAPEIQKTQELIANQMRAVGM